jgi:hypothetical protein
MRAPSRKSICLMAGLPLLAVIGGAALYFGWRREPDFYRSALACDASDQVRASNELLEQASALVTGVHKQGKWQALFTAEQINGWLAVDVPKNHHTLLPRDVDRPRVALERGRVRVACGRGSGALATVVTLSLEPYLIQPNELAIRIRGVHAGWFPLPLEPILKEVSRAAARAELPLRWEQAGGDPIAVIALSTRRDDGRVLSVENLEIHEGEIYVAGTSRSSGWPSEDPSPGSDPPGPVLQAKLPRDQTSPQQ